MPLPAIILAAALAAAPSETRLHPAMEVAIAHTFQGRPLRFGEVSLINRRGNVFSVTRLAYLISDFRLHRAGGGEIEFPGQRAFLDPQKGITGFQVGAAPAGDYDSVSFRIGVLPALNHADPASFRAGDPLNPLVNGLHWNWQGGYVFLALEGRYQAADGALSGYVYHLATDRNLTQISVPAHFTVHRGECLQLALAFDVSRLFDAEEPIQISAALGMDSTHSMAGDPLAAMLRRNLARSFSFAGAGDSPAEAATASAPTPLPPGTTAYPLALPPSFPAAQFPPDNPPTIEGVALGEKLFTDPRLSGNGRQSCASCHQPQSAFSDGGRAVSVGIDGKPGTRNAPSLLNLLWSPTYAWDGRRSRLRDQALAAITAPNEMHASPAAICAALSLDPAMARAFAKAFGDAFVTPENLGLALEQYVLTRVSADSKFDRAKRLEAEFTDEEKRGLLLFITEYDPARGRFGADCFHCHGGNDLFTDFQFKNTGLDRGEPSADSGRESVTGSPQDLGKFKTPSLRNVAVTGPYMHDGRFRTLDEVIAHYCDDVQDSPTLDPNLAKHPQRKLPLSVEDRKALVAFLKALTDSRYAVTATR